MFTPNGLSVRSRILRISSRIASSSPDDVSMIPIAPASETAEASCARAIHPIGRLHDRDVDAEELGDPVREHRRILAPGPRDPAWRPRRPGAHRRPDSCQACAPTDATEAAMDIAQLPFIDEHTATLDADAADVWPELLEAIDRSFSHRCAELYARTHPLRRVRRRPDPGPSPWARRCRASGSPRWSPAPSSCSRVTTASRRTR